MKRAVAGFLLLLFTTGLTAAITVAWALWANSPSKFNENITFDIEEGMPAHVVARNLEAAGAVRSRQFFTLLARFKGYDRAFKFGRHEIPPGLTAAETARLLTENPPSPPDYVVRVIEGLNINETASVLQAQAGIDSTAFVMAAFDTALVRESGFEGGSLEGYLFPETYFVRVGTTPREMIGRMVDQFDAVFTDSLRERAKESGMSIADIVTLASLIVTEAGNDAEKPVVSSVFHHRLARGWALECNATIQYALGEKRRVLDEDLTIDSPYNTYVHAGLPPGPIASPGEASLRAALFPADTKYLYFVSNGRGGHVFSRTLADHNQAVREYKRLRRRSSPGK